MVATTLLSGNWLRTCKRYRFPPGTFAHSISGRDSYSNAEPGETISGATHFSGIVSAVAKPAKQHRKAFGELALFDRSPRSATVVALEDTQAALLAADDFITFLESHPLAVRTVLEALARTVRRLSDRVEDLIFLDVPSRVAKYLLDLAQQNGGPDKALNLTQDELAAFTGASRVSVNRVLGDLERRDLISIRRRRIAILDPNGLAKEVRV